jgi:Holliday junction resolvase RusA-like endonuclease
MLLPYPIANNRYYRNYQGRTIKSPEARKWSLEATAIARRYVDHEPIDRPLSVALILHPRQNKDGKASATRLDLDAIAKCVLDTMQGIVYKDDKQIETLCLGIGPPVIGGGLTMLYSVNAEELVTEWLQTRKRG